MTDDAPMLTPEQIKLYAESISMNGMRGSQAHKDAEARGEVWEFAPFDDDEPEMRECECGCGQMLPGSPNWRAGSSSAPKGGFEFL